MARWQNDSKSRFQLADHRASTRSTDHATVVRQMRETETDGRVLGSSTLRSPRWIATSDSARSARLMVMRQAVISYVSVLAISVGCGGAMTDAAPVGSGGAGGSIAYGGYGNGGHGGVSIGGSGYGGTVGGFAGSGCQALQDQAQQAADTSCQLDSDCVHPAHTAGDCTECGVVLNATSEESSLAAVRSVCLQFSDQGCVMALHSCFAMKAYCDSGACRLTIP